MPLNGCVPCPSSFAIDLLGPLRYNDRIGGDDMTGRELGFIKAAARGLRLAREKLTGPDAAHELERAVNAMADDAAQALSNHDIAFFAAMLVAWEDAGKPDFFT